MYGIFHHILNGYLGFNIVPKSLNLYELLVQPFLLGNGYGYNVAAWFLMTLYLVEVIGCLLAWALRKVSKDKWLIALAAVTFVLAFIAAVKGQNYQYGYIEDHSPLLVSGYRVCYLMFWYVFAMFFRRYLEEYEKKVPTAIVLIGVIVIEFVLKGMFGEYSSIVYCAAFFDNVFVVFLAALIGIWFWLRIAEVLAPVMMRSRLTNYIGDHTFSLMMHQGVVGMFVSTAIVASGIFPVAADQSGFFIDVWFKIGIDPSMRIIYPIAVTAIVLVLVWVFEKVRDKLKEKLPAKEAQVA